MNQQIEFLGFTSTPGERHAGIASVRLNKQIVLRFRIVPKKDGSGFFPAPASYKISDASGDRYVEAFMLDSRSDHEDLVRFVMSEVKKAQHKAQPSVFSTDNQGQAMQQPTEEELPF